MNITRQRQLENITQAMVDDIKIKVPEQFESKMTPYLRSIEKHHPDGMLRAILHLCKKDTGYVGSLQFISVEYDVYAKIDENEPHDQPRVAIHDLILTIKNQCEHQK